MSDLRRETSEELDRWLVELAYGEESSVPAEARARIASDPALAAQLAELKEARALASMPLEEPSAEMDLAILDAADAYLAGLETPANSDGSEATAAAAPPAPIDLAAAREARRRAEVHPAAAAAHSIGEALAKPDPAPSWRRFVRPLSLAASLAVVVGGSWLLLQNKELSVGRAPADSAAPAPAPVAEAGDALEKKAELEEFKAAAREAEESRKRAEDADKMRRVIASAQEAAAKSASAADASPPPPPPPARVAAERKKSVAKDSFDGVGGALGVGGGAGTGTGYGASGMKEQPAEPETFADKADDVAPRGGMETDEALREEEVKTDVRRRTAVTAAAPAPTPPPPPKPATAPAPMAETPSVAPAQTVVPVLQSAPRDLASERLQVVNKSKLEALQPTAPPPAAAGAVVSTNDRETLLSSAATLVSTGRAHLSAGRNTQALGAFRSARNSLESLMNFAVLPGWQDAAAGEIDALLALGFEAEADRLAEQLARVAPNRVEVKRGLRRSRSQYEFDGSGNSAPTLDAAPSK